jgi:predicted nucleotidyltransferase
VKADKKIKKITQQFIDRYNPDKLLLFGSQAKNTTKPNSDIDLCVIIKVDDKHMLLTDMYLHIESNMPFDIVLYSPGEWEQCVTDPTSFAYHISKEGILLYG